MRPAAKINHAAREAFVHRHVGFAGERIFRMKTRAVSADAAFVAECGGESLPKHNAAVLDGVVRIHFQVAGATEFQIHDRVFGKQREHVVKKGDAGLDRRSAFAVEFKTDGNAGFPGLARDFCLPRFHGGH